MIHFSRQHSCHRFLFFVGSSSFSAFYLVVPCTAETDTCLQPNKPFHFYRIGTRADASVHKAFAYRYLSNNLHGCRRMDPSLPLPRVLLFLDTLRPRDTVGSEGVAAVCSGFCARSWVSWLKLHWSPCKHWPFFTP